MVKDFDLDFLRDAIKLVDGSLRRLDGEVQSSTDPDSFGIFDEQAYITGLGFVACQAYASAVANRCQSRNKKHEILALGPKHRTGRSMAELVNAAANYWKHSAEWSFGTLTRQAKQTLEVISTLDVDTKSPYLMVNVLYEILTPHPARFVNLVPFLTQWRDVLSK